MARIYVASSWRNDFQTEVVKRLREEGHEVYDFKNPPKGTGFGWRKVTLDPVPWSATRTREVLGHPIAEDGFNSDFEAMQWADVIVMVQPCGRSAALALGWGAGAGKHTYVLLADDQEPELMLKVADALCTSLDEVVQCIAVGRSRVVRVEEYPLISGRQVHLSCTHSFITKNRAPTHYDCDRCVRLMNGGPF